MPVKLEVLETMDEEQSEQRETAKPIDQLEPIGFGQVRHAEHFGAWPKLGHFIAAIDADSRER